jgi:hypothetical protein
MKNILYTIIACGLLCCTSACRKYVEIAPQQTRELKLTSDYQQLLYNTSAMDISYYLAVYSGDDAGSDEVKWQTTLNAISANAYTWAEKFYGSNDEDQEWAAMYKEVYICNTVITGVMGSVGGTQAQKQAALSSALVHRALLFYTLVNVYAKQYDAATAAADPGIPMLLEPKLFTDLTRASVQKVYDQIEQDLSEALPGLPDLPDYNSNPSKAAAYAILARLHLNKRAFTEAERYANLALSLKNTLIDLNAYVAAPLTFPTKIKNPEEILFKRTQQYPAAFPLSTTLLNILGTKDLRYQVFTIAGTLINGSPFTGRAYNRARLANDGAYVGPGVPEMMLISAECEARANQPANAMAFVNNLRKKRFKPADYTDLSAGSGAAALQIVIDERTREFMGRGFRWFDQKRLSKDAGLVPSVTRVFLGNTYTLAPGSNRYVFPIADKYLQFNPEITQNPR